MLKLFDADPDPGSGIFLTLDPVWKNSNPGSEINITDPQHRPKVFRADRILNKGFRCVSILIIKSEPAVVAGLSTLEYMTTHRGRRVLGSQSTKNLIHL